MKINFREFSHTSYAALSAWIAVFSVCIFWVIGRPSAEYLLIQVCILFFAYIACFLYLTGDKSKTTKPYQIQVILFVQLSIAFALMLLLPLNILSILTIIWVAVLPFFYPLRTSLLLFFIVLTTWFFIYSLRWNQDGVVLTALVYSSFHLFAMFMSYQAKDSDQARIEAEKLNSELQLTQGLLEQLTRQNERTRIARDLHDVLGHHLTALIINLQVAGRISEGEAKDKIEQCHSMSKLLLSDVREAVSTLRENSTLDFNSMITLMVSKVPKLKVNIAIDADLDIEDMTLARNLLFCIQEAITNSLRHSGASEFFIKQTKQDGNLILELKDDGQVNKEFTKGNGINGIEERISEHRGEVILDQTSGSLNIKIIIPLNRPLSRGVSVN